MLSFNFDIFIIQITRHDIDFLVTYADKAFILHIFYCKQNKHVFYMKNYIIEITQYIVYQQKRTNTKGKLFYDMLYVLLTG